MRWICLGVTEPNVDFITYIGKVYDDDRVTECVIYHPIILQSL